MNKQNIYAICLALGVGVVGVILGLMFHNLFLGLCTGFAIGIILAKICTRGK